MLRGAKYAALLLSETIEPPAVSEEESLDALFSSHVSPDVDVSFLGHDAVRR